MTGHGLIAIKLDAGVDTNGNGRRGWILFKQDGRFVAYVDEYNGSDHRDYATKHGYEYVNELTTVPTTATFLRAARKWRM